MKKRNRSLPIIIATVSVVSLVTVGFSTWLFQYQEKTSGFGTQVSCMPSAAQTAVLSVKMCAKEEVPNKEISSTNNIDNTIHLGEDIELPSLNDSVYGIYASNGKTDSSITIKANVELSKNYIENVGLPTEINYAYDAGSEDFFKSDTDRFNRGVTSNYLELPSKTLMDVVSYKDQILALDDVNTITTSNGWFVKKQTNKAIYDITKVITLDFSWGSYFNKKSPSVYYNELLENLKKEKTLTKDEIYAFFDDVKFELDAMYEKCNKNTNSSGQASLALIATLNLPK